MKDQFTIAEMFKGVDLINPGVRGGPLYSSQDRLPKLPVPRLEETLPKYLKSALPFHSTATGHASTEAAVQSALSGKDCQLVRKLQSRLESRAQVKPNWLSDWWNDLAYFGYRDAVIPYTNYFYVHTNDPERKTNLLRAPVLVKGFLTFRRLVESERLEPEKGKGGPLDMSSYAFLFNSCRIPRVPVDYAKKADVTVNNHLVVVRNGKYWAFKLVHPVTGKELSEEEIRFQLERILQDPDSECSEQYPVGALTGANRDTWAQARNILLAASPSNGQVLRTIEDSVFILALDHSSPVTSNEKAWATWTGGPGALNRWFDKQELVVFDNGVSGYNGEHSTMDGTPTLRLNDFALSAIAHNKIDMGTNYHDLSSLPQPQRLMFYLNSSCKHAVRQAQRDFDDLMATYEVEVLNFEGYGKETIKAFGVSPDAWVQMVIQLAYYKLSDGIPVAVYESAQTRKFLLGRTETIRSCSQESVAFCRAFLDRNTKPQEVYALFQAAVHQHLQYAQDAADGRGVDRHLLGLKQVIEDGERVPDLFTDPAYTKSSTWRLSTSQISSEYLDFLGFGPVVPGGYGCSYCVKQTRIDFGLSSRMVETSKLAHSLQESALQLRAFFERIKAR